MAGDGLVEREAVAATVTAAAVEKGQLWPYTTVHGAPVLQGAEFLLFKPNRFQITAGSLGYVSRVRAEK